MIAQLKISFGFWISAFRVTLRTSDFEKSQRQWFVPIFSATDFFKSQRYWHQWLLKKSVALTFKKVSGTDTRTRENHIWTEFIYVKHVWCIYEPYMFFIYVSGCRIYDSLYMVHICLVFHGNVGAKRKPFWSQISALGLLSFRWALLIFVIDLLDKLTREASTSSRWSRKISHAK